MQVSKVLVVDCDRAMRDALVLGLRFVGLEAHGADGAATARSWLRGDEPDVMVLSDNLPDCAASDLLVARGGSFVVLISGGKTASRDTNYVADATLLRPISVGRVVEQVESLLNSRDGRPDEARCSFGGLSFDRASSRLENGGDAVQLGGMEARLLWLFMHETDKVFSRAQLLGKLWPVNVRVEMRTVDVHIRRLRLSLAALGLAGYVQTVRGAGYRFSASPQ